MRVHVVKRGENLSQVAIVYRLTSWRVLYEHPSNSAFRKLRPNPSLIVPGDRIFIPDAADLSKRSAQILRQTGNPPARNSVHPVSNDVVVGSGNVFVGIGIPSVARIPVPGTQGLHVELSPRGFVPKGGSTSTLFIQDVTGKRHLRLDYGYNKNTGTVDYHWNQKGTFDDFGIKDHSPAGKGGKLLYDGARYYKYAGRALLVVGVAMGVYSIVVAKKRWRQVTEVVAGWAGAWAGAQLVGTWGAGMGSVEPGGGTAVGAIVGGIVGGVAGGLGVSWAAGQSYDYVEETFFEPVPQAQ